MHLVELQTTGHRPRSVRQFVRDEQTGELGGEKKKEIWEVKIKSSAKEYFPLNTCTKMTSYERAQPRAAPLTRPEECFGTAMAM